jgi:hypothetical protein
LSRFEHVDGQFATTVFIPIPPSDALAAVLASPNASTSSLTPIPATDLHLSLSRTAPIVDAQRHSLLAELRKAIQKTARKHLAGNNTSPSDVRIRIGAGEPRFLTNDDRSRTFLALTADGTDADETALLLGLVDATSSVFTRHGLPAYYDEKLLHVSIAWRAGKQRETSDTSDTSDTPGTTRHAVPPYVVSVDSVTCRIGKKDHRIPLR